MMPLRSFQPRWPITGCAALGVPDGVEHLAVRVELELFGRGVADPHRCGSSVALEVVERVLLEIGAAVDAVHDLQRARCASLACSSTRSRSHARNATASSPNPSRSSAWTRERRVAKPGVAVVPVALAADLLGQTGRRGRDRRAGRGVREQLQRDRGSIHHVAPAASIRRAVEPALATLATVCRKHAVELVGGDALRRASRRRFEDEPSDIARTSRSSSPTTSFVTAFERHRRVQRQRRTSRSRTRRRARSAAPCAPRARSRTAAPPRTRRRTSPRGTRTMRTIECRSVGCHGWSIGMKSWISATPPADMNRVINTPVSGKYSCFVA